MELREFPPVRESSGRARSPACLRNLAVASRPMAGDRDVVTPPVVGARQLSNESNCSFGDAESVHDARRCFLQMRAH